MAAYKKIAVNYNRDVEIFPILITLIQNFLPKNNYMRNYHSPTDMDVNKVKEGITNDEIISRSAKREIIFYYYRYRQEYFRGLVDEKTLEKMEQLLKKAKCKNEDLPTVKAARKAKKIAENTKGKGKRGIYCGAAIELKNGKIITGKNSPLLHAEAACILNAIKYLANIPDKIHLLSPQVIKSFKKIKEKALREESKSLELNEILIALAISESTNPTVNQALKQLPLLRECYIHTTHQPSLGDETIFRKLGIWLTTDGEITSQAVKKSNLKENF